MKVSISTISHTLRAEGWFKKMIRRKANEQNADLRDECLHELSAFASHHLVYIDESSCDRRVGLRRTGWSPVGITPVQTERFHRGDRYHIFLHTHRTDYYWRAYTRARRMVRYSRTSRESFCSGVLI